MNQKIQGALPKRHRPQENSSKGFLETITNTGVERWTKNKKTRANGSSWPSSSPYHSPRSLPSLCHSLRDFSCFHRGRLPGFRHSFRFVRSLGRSQKEIPVLRSSTLQTFSTRELRKTARRRVKGTLPASGVSGMKAEKQGNHAPKQLTPPHHVERGFPGKPSVHGPKALPLSASTQTGFLSTLCPRDPQRAFRISRAPTR